MKKFTTGAAALVLGAGLALAAGIPASATTACECTPIYETQPNPDYVPAVEEQGHYETVIVSEEIPESGHYETVIVTPEVGEECPPPAEEPEEPTDPVDPEEPIEEPEEPIEEPVVEEPKTDTGTPLTVKADELAFTGVEEDASNALFAWASIAILGGLLAVGLARIPRREH